MNKKNVFLAGIFLLTALLANSQEYPGFRVIGRHLYDKCGEKVILRGVANPNIWYQRDGIPQYEEIEKTGANVVRIVWETKGSANDLDEAITNCIELKMIPMVELHDATGDLSKLQICIDYWVSNDVVDVILKHEEYLLINIANECGAWGVTNAEFRAAYVYAVAQMRDAGIHVPLVIDGSDWGKDINILQSEGPSLIESDPDHNLIFSVHMWWPVMYNYKESDIAREIEESVNMGLPLIVGEFSQMHGSCEEKNITANNSIAYLTIIKQCHLHEIGYIAWSWFGNCNPFWDLTTDGTYDNLYDWGLEVAVTDTNSIKNTSVRPYSIVHGICNPNPTGIEIQESDFTESFTLQPNYPNPFNPTTNIRFELGKPSDVQLIVYNILGQKVATLANSHMNAGAHTVQFSASRLASGIYFYCIKAGSFSQVRKMVLIR